MTLAIIGWAIVHSLWQWTLIGGVAALVLGCLGRARAHTRYVVGATALLAMIVATLATAAAATLTLDPPLRHRVIYSFGGALIMPELFARGATVLRGTAIVWVFGVSLVTVRLMYEFLRVRTLARCERLELDRESRALVDGLQRAMCLRQRVAVYHSTLASVPMVLGARRPQVLLPADAAVTLTPDQTRGILAHEFGHIQRWDVIANLFQVAFDLFAFYHPAARWVSRQLRLEREYACDEMVVAFTNDAHGYARALATLEDARSECHLVVAAASGTLLDRIERIVGRARPALTPFRGGLACVIAIVVAVALFTIALNMPPPWMPPGIRLRLPGPQMNRAL